MNFSLNIICKNDIIEEKEAQAAALLSSLGIPEKAKLEPYWKDSRLSQISLGVKLNTPNFNLIKEHLSKIAGTEVSLSASLDEWEFSHYASIEELICGKSAAFVVCEVF